MSFEQIGSAFIEAEVALRKSIFLKGYELGKGRPLTNEEQQEVVDTLYQKAYDDSLERIREEIADMTQNIKSDRKKRVVSARMCGETSGQPK